MPLYNPTRAELKKHWRREVYRNLHKEGHVYSVRKEGLVEGHCNFIGIDKPVFAVGPKGNQRVRDEERKNVHAVIRGYMNDVVWHDSDEVEWSEDAAEYKLFSSMNEYLGYDWKEVTYNPYKYKTFVTVEDEEPIIEAYKAVVGETVWALVPLCHQGN